MAAVAPRPVFHALHPLHAVLLASTLPLFLGALLSDIAYAQTYHVQWTNFASWLIVGGLVLAGIVMVIALVGLLRADRRDGRSMLYAVLVVGVFVLGLFNALVHARDAWAVMPGAVVLSTLTFLLAAAATWMGFAGRRVAPVHAAGDRA